MLKNLSGEDGDGYEGGEANGRQNEKESVAAWKLGEHCEIVGFI